MTTLSSLPLDDCAAETWTLREALSTILVDPVEITVVAMFHVAERENRPADISLRREQVWGMLRAKVASGAISMTGFSPGAIQPSPIHKDFAADASPDFDRNTLTLGAVVYHGVRVRMGEADTTGMPAVSTPRTRPKVDQSVADTWMKANATRDSKREGTIKQCVGATACTDRQAREAWNKLPEDVKGTRGTRKG